MAPDLATFIYRTPQALQSVLGPCGPARQTGVVCVPHWVQQWPFGLGAGAFGGLPLGEARLRGFGTDGTGRLAAGSEGTAMLG